MVVAAGLGPMSPPSSGNMIGKEDGTFSWAVLTSELQKPWLGRLRTIAVV